MPVLASFVFNTPSDFALERSLLYSYAVGWWNMTIINPAQPTILQEIPFGGYRVVLNFKSWFWSAHGGATTITDALEDLYALPPGGGSPLSVGTCIVSYQWSSILEQNIITYALSPSDNHFYINKFPQITPPYWSLPRHPETINLPTIYS